MVGLFCFRQGEVIIGFLGGDRASGELKMKRNMVRFKRLFQSSDKGKKERKGTSRSKRR